MKALSKFLVLILTLGVLAYVFQNMIFHVKALNVSVLQSHGVPDAILKQVEKKAKQVVSDLKGKPLLKVPLKQVRETLEKDSKIHKVFIRRRFPSELDIIVEPQKYMALILPFPQGKFYPLTEEAKVLSPLGIGELMSLPVLRGKIFIKSFDVRRKALNLLKSLPEEGPLSQQTVSEVWYSKSKGFSLYISRVTVRVELGEGNFAKKIQRVNRAVRYLNESELKDKVIDARFLNKVVIKVKTKI
ncbi:MAG: FtsQ-type POTRA domain-containing protein [Bdellovibrio sp.]|nr:MAG: FtsQ-type POTRA domain-containing protein [Bdellovibrio sp.]